MIYKLWSPQIEIYGRFSFINSTPNPKEEEVAQIVIRLLISSIKETLLTTIHHQELYTLII